MPKRVNENQHAGFVGESEFIPWATKMGWYPCKITPDLGFDFLCQISECSSDEKASAEVKGKSLYVSVRSTEEVSEYVRIYRSDAELYLSTIHAFVLAIVRRAPLGQTGQIAIRFPDKDFIAELEVFLKGSTQSHYVRFSSASLETEEIGARLAELLRQPFTSMIARLRAEIRLKPFSAKPRAEILHTASDTVAYVYFDDPEAVAPSVKASDITNALCDIGMSAIFTQNSLVPSRLSMGLSAVSDIVTHSSMQSNVDGESNLNVSTATIQIGIELSQWNYDRALQLVERLEDFRRNKQPELPAITPELLFLMARVRVICADINNANRIACIEQAKALLAESGARCDSQLNAHLEADIEALKASIDNIENGPDSALALLANRTDSYAFRIRLAILLNKPDIEQALDLLKETPQNDAWCELASHIYAFAGLKKETATLIKWVADRGDHLKYAQCILHAADGMLARSLSRHKIGDSVRPSDLETKERDGLREILGTICPIVDPVIKKGRIENGIDKAAVKLGWLVNFLLEDREAVIELAMVMINYRPVPLDMVRSVICGLINAPPDLPDQIRQDYPDNLEANILAGVVQSTFLDQHKEALAFGKELIRLIRNDEDKTDLFKLFHHIWLELDDEEASECEMFLSRFSSDNPKLLAWFDATLGLRKNDPSQSIQALDSWKEGDDPFWLQLMGEALLQSDNHKGAIDLFFIAAMKTLDPTLLLKTADLAMRAKEMDIATSCYEKLISVRPENCVTRGNLAYLYVTHIHDLAKAAEQFRELQHLEPNNLLHSLNLAAILGQLYRPDEALKLYDEMCSAEVPDIRALTGRAQLFFSLGDPDAAFNSLSPHRSSLWDSVQFLLVFMNAAYATGQEEAAHEALLALKYLREQGKVDSRTLTMMTSADGITMMKKQVQEAQDRNEFLHSEMLRGRMTWIWADEIMGHAVYWGWRVRTEDLKWIGDDPVNRASRCIYATNGFHSQRSEQGSMTLLPLRCPPKGVEIVADISALITLHRLGLLEATASYFGKLLVPQGYLPRVLEDGRKLVLHQRSRKSNAEQILSKMSSGSISILSSQETKSSCIAVADEHGESKAQCYHIVDVLRPAHVCGAISDTSYNQMLKICTKKSNLSGDRPELVRLQPLLFELSTLETLTQFDFLDTITRFYKVHIKEAGHTDLNQRLEVLRIQEETRKWHFELWDFIKEDSRFQFMPHFTPKALVDEGGNLDEHLAFWGSFVAEATGNPLLIDDRVCQALRLNEHPEQPSAAFGTDVLISEMLNNGVLDLKEASRCYLQLMKWRYRFIMPQVECLASFAGDYRSNPPGQCLREVAEYSHDCLRDAGLFSGIEKTDHNESMAIRVFLFWLNIVPHFLIRIWTDENICEESASRITTWCLDELVPSSPCLLHGSIRVRISEAVKPILLSHILIDASIQSESDRIHLGIRALRDNLNLNDIDYLRMLSGVLSNAQNQDESLEETKQSSKALQVRMFKYGTHDIRAFDARSFRVFQNLGFLKKEACIQDPVDQDVLRELTHPRRKKLPNGPMILYESEKSKTSLILLKIANALLHDQLEGRDAALECLEIITSEDSAIVTPKTKNVMLSCKQALTSSHSDEWRAAAVSLYDALENDILFALSGVHQSLESSIEIENGLASYVPKILHPQIISFDSLQLGISNPEAEHENLTSIIHEVLESATSLIEGCATYYQKLGYLPLAPQYGMVSLIEKWVLSHPETEVWDEIWSWANSAFGPVPRYHACCFFALHPDLIPRNKVPTFWEEILKIISDPIHLTGEAEIGEKWALRCTLARHYVYHIEAQIPGNDGANVGCFAWWFAEKVSSLFPDEDKAAKFYRENWGIQALYLSSKVWTVANPPILKSSLRCATLTNSSPWAIGLLSMMGRDFEGLLPSEQSDEIRTRFHDAFVSQIMSVFPFSTYDSDIHTFTYESSLSAIILKWAALQPAEVSDALKQLITSSQLLESNTEICRAIRVIGTSPMEDQIAIARALKSRAFTSALLADEIWEIISDADWRIKTLGAIELRVLSLILDALCLFQVDKGEKWFSLLPHFMAELCEQAEDLERRRHLFLYTIHASLASDTVSAVRRLVRGNRKDLFVDLVEEYRNQVRAMSSDYPAWVLGRLRSLLSNLRVE